MGARCRPVELTNAGGVAMLDRGGRHGYGSEGADRTHPDVRCQGPATGAGPSRDRAGVQPTASVKPRNNQEVIRNAWVSGRLDARGSLTRLADELGVTTSYVSLVVKKLRDDPVVVAMRRQQAVVPDPIEIIEHDDGTYSWACGRCRADRAHSKAFETRDAAVAGALRHATSLLHVEWSPSPGEMAPKPGSLMPAGTKRLRDAFPDEEFSSADAADRLGVTILRARDWCSRAYRAGYLKRRRPTAGEAKANLNGGFIYRVS